MKKVLFCFLATCFTLSALAQNAINIKKIALTTGWGGMTGHTTVGIELYPKNGKWFSYQTYKDSVNRFEGDGKVKSIHLNKLVAMLSNADVNHFLDSIVISKPIFNYNIFKVTPETVKAYILQTHPQPKPGPTVSDYVNEATVQEAITVSSHIVMTDVWNGCKVVVIGLGGDTLTQITTQNRNICMQPWTLNGTPTYDMEINKLFIMAMGKEDYPNKQLLQNTSLNEAVLSYIDRKYADKPARIYRWNFGYPENLELIKSTYQITDLKIIDPRGQGNQSHCTLHNNSMPINSFIDAKIDIADSASIKKLVKFKDTLITHFKAGNFVLNYYDRIAPGKMIFPWSCDFNATGYIVMSELKKQIPFLNKVDPNKLVYLTVESPNGNSVWLLLPDNKIILLSHFGYNTAGLNNDLLNKIIAPIIPNMYSQAMLFDETGKKIELN